MMKKLIALILAVLTGMTGFAGVALAERDWSQFIAVPTEDQLSQPGAYRSPYITFLPSFDTTEKKIRKKDLLLYTSCGILSLVVTNGRSAAGTKDGHA